METNKKGIALFSGRFNVPHIGHILTIFKLCREFDMIKIVILDYPGRKVLAHWARDIFDDCLKHTGYKWKIYINSTHFAKISMEELSGYGPFDAYYAGNIEVLNNIRNFEKELEFEARWIDRSWFYEASRYDFQ
jgi:nicotinamide mononucleotide adenylyltransferase